jgi:hypothetical protein
MVEQKEAFDAICCSNLRLMSTLVAKLSDLGYVSLITTTTTALGSQL